MHLQIREICFFFEKLLDTNCNYFNLKDYKIYSVEERQVLISDDTYESNDFLLIPQIERNEIVERYLIKRNNKSLLRKKGDKDFDRRFHWFIEDYQLADDWKHFEQSELIAFASEWCKQNQIEFTEK